MPLLNGHGWRLGGVVEPARFAGTSPGVPGLEIPTYRQALAVARAEFARARRYGHPLTVLVMGLTGEQGRPEVPFRPGSDGRRNQRLDAHGADKAWQGPCAPEPWPAAQAFFLLGSLLHDAVRESDVVTYEPKRHLYVLFLPESDRRSARGAVRRISLLFEGRTTQPLRTGMAGFPDDGLTIDVVLECARRRLRVTPPEVDVAYGAREAG